MIKQCRQCKNSFTYAVYGGKKESKANLDKRNYCSRICFLNYSREKSKRHYENNKDKIKKKKKENQDRYRKENPCRSREIARDATERIRIMLFSIYGDSCKICGFSDRRALSLDHINNDGAKERADLGIRGSYRKAIKDVDHSRYRTLCMNCQWITRKYERMGDSE